MVHQYSLADNIVLWNTGLPGRESVGEMGRRFVVGIMLTKFDGVWAAGLEGAS